MVDAIKSSRSFTQSSLFQILKQRSPAAEAVGNGPLKKGEIFDVNVCLANAGDFLRAVTHLRQQNKRGGCHHNLFEVDVNFLTAIK